MISALAPLSWASLTSAIRTTCIASIALTPAHAEAAADVQPGGRCQLGNEVRQAVQRHVVPSERLALLRDLIVDGLVVCEPAWPQDGVVQIGLFNQGGRVSIRIQHAAVVLARHFA